MKFLNDEVIKNQIDPSLIDLYDKYCSYEVDQTLDHGYGLPLTEPPVIMTRKDTGIKLECMALAEWAKRKGIATMYWKEGGRIGPLDGSEGDIICFIICCLTRGDIDTAGVITKIYKEDLDKIGAYPEVLRKVSKFKEVT